MLFKDKDDLKKILIPVIIAIIFIIGLTLILIGNKKYGHSYDTYYIKILGDKEMTIYQNTEYIEPGYKASNSKGEDLTDDVIVEKNLDINTIGEYEIKYLFKDITAVRKVNVIEKPNGATYIHLLGDLTIYLNVGEEYNEPGYEVIDTYDGGLKDKTKVENNINNNKTGVYKVTYSVVNSSGITSSKQRTVIVMDSDISLTLSNDNYTNSDIDINVYIKDANYDYMILPDGSKTNEYKYAYRISENGAYNFIIYSRNNAIKEATIEVNNINKTIPLGTCKGEYKNGYSTVNINATDDIGIAKYAINGNIYATNEITLDGEYKEIMATIYDKAGNTSDIICTLSNNNQASTKTPGVNNLTNGNMKNISDKAPIWKYTTPNSGNIYVNHYTSSNGQSFTFWSYVPKNATKNLPLIIYIPPVGGDDYYTGSYDAFYDGPLEHLGYHYCSYNAIVVHFEHQNGYKNQQYTYSYMELINKIVKEFDIDKNNISIMGFSNGCYGVNDMINQNPTYFSSAVLIGCSLANPSNYVNTALWCFSGSGDGLSSYYGTPMPNFVEQVNNMGGHAWFTGTGTGHNIFEGEDKNSPLLKHKVVDWMISSNKLDNSYKSINSCK